MTLRLRLVLALLGLLVCGLGVFGVTTYSLFARSQRDRLDQQLRAAVPTLARILDDGRGGPGGTGRPDRQGASSSRDLAQAVPYSELRAGDGTLTDGAVLVPDTAASTPALPDRLVADDGGRTFTTGSTTGSVDWRVFVQRQGPPGAAILVAALPTSSVDAPLRRLLVIELSAAAGLLVVIAVGASLIMRRGLRPLEQMAGSARGISSGDLTERVEPADDRSEVGELGLALNTMLDEIEQAFREREATEARLRQFLADASHELRTPLTSIQGFAELFRLGPEASAVDLPVIMRRIEEESHRMKILVEDLLLLARMDQTRPIEPTEVDLAVLAADACSDAVAADPTRSVTLDAPDPAVVIADGDHLRQALANLVTNAVRHTPAGTPIEVGARLHDASATLTVRDHGAGLSHEALQHAFDRFWQADGARTGASAGLGLPIVAAIAAEHHGTVTAANLADGGACFTITLPAAPVP